LRQGLLGRGFRLWTRGSVRMLALEDGQSASHLQGASRSGANKRLALAQRALFRLGLWQTLVFD
jgi:hypothetical protein